MFRIFRIDWTLKGTYIGWFLTLLAITLGILVAVQTNNHASIRVLEREQKLNKFQLEELQKELKSEKQVDREFQAEQRQRLLDLAKVLNEIRLEELKRGMRR